jgi:hypothetical protein
MEENNERPAVADRAPEADDSDTTATGFGCVGSRTVSWQAVHAYAVTLATGLGVDLSECLPFPGALSWLALPDDSPVKKASMLLAASQRVLHVEIDQEARAEASKAIADAADWPQVAREIQQLDAARRSGARIERRPM